MSSSRQQETPATVASEDPEIDEAIRRAEARLPEVKDRISTAEATERALGEEAKDLAYWIENGHVWQSPWPTIAVGAITGFAAASMLWAVLPWFFAIATGPR